MPLASGARLGPYEIQALLGAGGMGEVYRAKDTRLDRTVAVKVLTAQASGASHRGERLAQEARAISRLSHPHICALYDVGEHQGAPFLVMEHVQGKTLAERLESGPLALAEVLRIGVEIAEALDAAHREGVVHRDLKPGNVMLTREGVKLLDFGLAKLHEAAEGADLQATASKALTEEGEVLGTVPYMSPEQLEGRKLDARTDIFSLGAVLYEAITGVRPFQGNSRAGLIAAILKEEPPLVTSLQPLTPPALERVVKRCLAKEPDDRWQSARDLAAELRWVAEGGSEAGLARPVAARRRGRSLLWGGVAGVVLAGGVFAWISSRAASRPHAPAFEQITFRRGHLNQARFDPSSGTIVYGAAWEGRPHQLFSTRQGGYESRLLFEQARVLSVSRSGEMALLLDSQGYGILARVPLAGGAPRELLERVLDADWAPGGSEMAVVRRLGPSKFVVEFPIGKKVYESDSRVSSVRVSPKGDRIALAGVSGAEGGQIVVVDRSGGRTIPAKGWAWLQGIAWAAAGDEVWFTASRAGTRELPALWATSLSGKERLVARMPVELFLNDIAGDGKVLLTARDARAGMLCLPPGAAKEAELGWLGYSWVEALSPDGKTILFVDGAKGDDPAVYVRAADGSLPVRLGEGHPRGLSPDGMWVVAVSAGMNEWFLLPTRTGTPRKLAPGPIVRLKMASWLDANRLVLSGDEEGRPDRVYIQDIENDTIRAITPEGFSLPRHAAATPDGKELLAMPKGKKWSLLPIDGGDPRPIPGLEAADEPLQWSANGRVLYVAQHGPSTPETAVDVYRVDIASGRRDFFKRLSPPDPAGVDWIERVVLTPDGKSYCYTYRQSLGALFVAEGLK